VRTSYETKIIARFPSPPGRKHPPLQQLYW